MSTLQSVQEAQRDLQQLEVAIGAVSTGLDAVEAAVEVADTARRGARRLFRVAVVIGLVVVAVVVIRRVMQPADEPDPTAV